MSFEGLILHDNCPNRNIDRKRIRLRGKNTDCSFVCVPFNAPLLCSKMLLNFINSFIFMFPSPPIILSLFLSLSFSLSFALYLSSFPLVSLYLSLFLSTSLSLFFFLSLPTFIFSIRSFLSIGRLLLSPFSVLCVI